MLSAVPYPRRCLPPPLPRLHPEPRPRPPPPPPRPPFSPSSSQALVGSLRSSPPPFPLPPSFSLPEYWDFPPFFTLQPNKATRSKQLRLWVDLLVAFASALTVAAAALPAPPPASWCLSPPLLPSIRCHPAARTLSLSPSSSAFALFSNRRVSRQLSSEAVAVVLEEAVQGGYGVWQEGRSVCLLSATAVPEWAERIHGWALEHGLEQSVATLYEVHASAAAAKQSQRTTERATPRPRHPHPSTASLTPLIARPPRLCADHSLLWSARRLCVRGAATVGSAGPLYAAARRSAERDGHQVQGRIAQRSI